MYILKMCSDYTESALTFKKQPIHTPADREESEATVLPTPDVPFPHHTSLEIHIHFTLLPCEFYHVWSFEGNTYHRRYEFIGQSHKKEFKLNLEGSTLSGVNKIPSHSPPPKSELSTDINTHSTRT